MEIQDMVLVIEGQRGVENYSVKTLDDFFEYYSGMLAENSGVMTEKDLLTEMVRLGRTAERGSDWMEIFISHDKTISVKLCKDLEQLKTFIGNYVEYSEEKKFDELHSSKECAPFFAAIGRHMDGTPTKAGYGYEETYSLFYPGKVVHNFNGHDYKILEKLNDRSYILLDLNNDAFVVATGMKEYMRFPKSELPKYENTVWGVDWEHGEYHQAEPTLVDFQGIKKRFSEPEEALDDMQKFDIEIKEILSRVETVEAECLDDAIEKAMQLYYSEKVVLDANDFKGVDFSKYVDTATKKR